MLNLETQNFTSNYFGENSCTSETSITEINIRPIRIPPKSSSYLNLNALRISTTCCSELLFEPPIVIHRKPLTTINSSPIQIWEGTILKLDTKDSAMHVMLHAKLTQAPRHSATIDLKWVSDQDKHLVCLGAVFYLSFFKQTRHHSINYSHELRFRRRPSWSQSNLAKVQVDATMLLKKMKPLPTVN